METQLYSNGNAISPKTGAETVYIDDKTIVEFINAEIQTLRRDIEEPLKAKINTLETKLKEAQSQLTSIISENNNLRVALSTAQNDIELLKNRLDNLENTSDFTQAFSDQLKSNDTTNYLNSLLFDTSSVNQYAEKFISDIVLQVSLDDSQLEDRIRTNLGFAPKYRTSTEQEREAPANISAFQKTSELSTSLHSAVNDAVAKFRLDVGLDNEDGTVIYQKLPAKGDFANFVLSDNSFGTFKQECKTTEEDLKILFNVDSNTSLSEHLSNLGQFNINSITNEDLASKINASGVLQPYAKIQEVASQLSSVTANMESTYNASWVQSKIIENDYLKNFVEATSPTRNELVTTVNSQVSASLDSHLSQYALKSEVSESLDQYASKREVSESLSHLSSQYALKHEVPTPGQVAYLIEYGYSSSSENCNTPTEDASTRTDWGRIAGLVGCVDGTSSDLSHRFVPGGQIATMP